MNVSGGIVRVDLVSLSPIERDANNNPQPTFRQRLIFLGPWTENAGSGYHPDSSTRR